MAHEALERGSESFRALLTLQKGACPKARNAEGCTPAEEADEQAVIDVIKSHQ